MMRKLGRRGVSAAEFALWSSTLLLLALGTFDLGRQVEVSMRLEHAARAGAQMAMASSTDAIAIRTSVIQAWPALGTADVTVACQCAAAVIACGGVCAANQIRTVTITASQTLSPMLLRNVTRSQGNATLRLS